LVCASSSAGGKILFDAVDLDREIRFLEAGVGGEVRVGAGMTVAASILPGVTTSFHRDYPGVRLTIEVSHWSTLVGDLMDERIDFFISDISELDADPALEIMRLPDQRGSLFCRAGHPLLAGAIDRERLAACEFTGPPLPAEIARRLSAVLFGESVRASPLAVECNSMDMLRRLTLDTDLVQLNLEISLAKELRQGLLVDLWPGLRPRLPAMSPCTANGELRASRGARRARLRSASSPVWKRLVARTDAGLRQIHALVERCLGLLDSGYPAQCRHIEHCDSRVGNFDYAATLERFQFPLRLWRVTPSIAANSSCESFSDSSRPAPDSRP
jgi:DNA-binding transcriptional LysR family regulator